MYTRTHNECGISGRAGRAGISLQASIIEREGALEASERRWRRRLENHSLYRHHTGPLAKNQCNHPSQPAKNPLLLVLRAADPLSSTPCCSSKIPRATWIPSYVHDVKKSSKNRAVYVRTNFHSDSVNPIYIVDRPSRNNRRDNRAPSQISTLPAQRSIVVPEQETEERSRVTRHDSALTLIKTHTSHLRSKPVTAWFANSIDGIGRPYDGYLLTVKDGKTL